MDVLALAWLLLMLGLGAPPQTLARLGMQEFGSPSIRAPGSAAPADAMTRVELVKHLTDSARYDRNRRPQQDETTLNVSARSYIYMGQTHEGRLHLELRLTIKQELGFLDPRLRYAELSPGMKELTGDADLLRLLWTPHVFLANEQQSALLGSAPGHDVLVRVLPDGYVNFATRFSVSIVCTMKQGRFPFDRQECPLFFESWMDDANDLVLRWHGAHAENLILDSFQLLGWETESERRSRINVTDPDDDLLDRFGTTYSCLRLSFSLSRKYGFFLLDYYLPSVLLVVVSWVSFWLHPDIVPARVCIGSSTMLTFITLAVQVDRSLPVSYNKASEIWFVGCCTFIFGSLVEFAFVNTIWRHGQSVELKKVTTKHILRSTLGTPKPPRRRLLPQERYARRRTSSLPDLFKPHQAGQAPGSAPSSYEEPTRHDQAHHSHYNTIHAGATRHPTLASVCESAETIMTDDEKADTVSEGGSARVTFDSAATLAAEEHEQKPRFRPQVAGTRRQSLSASLAMGLRERMVGVRGSCGVYGQRLSVALTPAFTRMSASEVADWIDRRSRVFFPFTFFVFNAVYWVFIVYL